MNSSVSFFIYNEDKGLRSYPIGDAQTISIYKTVVEASTSKTQIVTHRREHLMYYNYAFQIKGSKDIFCISLLLNGVMITNFKGLFEVFDNAVSDVVIRGKLLKVTDNGRICLGDEQFIGEEADRIALVVKSDLQKLSQHIHNLPVANYSIPADSRKDFDFKKDDERNITQDAAIYPYVIIRRDVFALKSLSEIQRVLIKNFNEKEKLKEEVKQVKKEKKKMAFWAVVPWFVILLSGVLVCLFVQVNSNAEKTKLIDDKNKTITQNRSTIDSLFIANDSANIDLNLLRQIVLSLNDSIFLYKLALIELDSINESQNIRIDSFFYALEESKELQSVCKEELANCKNDFSNLINEEKRQKSNNESVGVNYKTTDNNTFNYPQYDAPNSSLVLKQVILRDNKTILILHYNNAEGYNWCYINPNAYLMVKRKKYNLLKANGISYFPNKTSLYGNKSLDFTLEFAPIPYNSKEIDFIEEKGSNWNISNIRLK